MFLGCIADDFTGATDLASALTGRGMRVALILGLPPARMRAPQADVVVIALKTRSVAPSAAVRESLRADRWLRAHGAQRIFFKYCSTFDSTRRGNIGPVAEALVAAHGGCFTIACPAFPENGRVVRDGELFVNGVPLNESGMEKHPLTPMTDANLVRVLQAQTSLRVGLIPLATVRAGAATLRTTAERLRRSGVGIAIADAIDNRDLKRLGAAFANASVLTGASGLALGLPPAWRRTGLLKSSPVIPAPPSIRGRSAILAGSCSGMTLKQIEAWKSAGRPALALDADALLRHPRAAVRNALTWAGSFLPDGPVLIHASAAPALVHEVQERHGSAKSAQVIERALASIARGLVRRGVRRFVIAGGETSGAIASALGIRMLRVGPAISPGVPWTVSSGKPALALALKSGNFGDEAFFCTALSKLP